MDVKRWGDELKAKVAAERAEWEKAHPLGTPQDQAERFSQQGHLGYNRRGAEMDSALGRLRRVAEGKDSHSAEQLRQGLQQNMAQQQAMAAGARGGNQMMAARNASMNSARAGSGLAGQQALAGIQERNAANQALLGGLGQARGQDLQATLGGQRNALGYEGLPEDPNFIDKYGNMIIGGLAMMSDRRAKKNISEGDDDAHAFAKALSAQTYDYKDESNGKGRQLGVMAQDIAKTKFGEQIIVKGPGGTKMLDAGKLAGALAATTAHLNKRLEKVESKK